MSKVFLTPFLIAALLLLPSCSSDEAKACEAAKQAATEFIIQRDISWNKYEESRKNKTFDNTNYNKAYEAEENSQRTIVNNQSCFTPQQVAEAQTYLSNLK